MAGQREQIGRQLRALYEAGNQSQLRALLSQADAATILRNLRYYEYLYSARRDKIQVYVDTAQRLNSLEKDITESIANLQATQAALEAENAQLQAERDSRKKLADEADANLRDKGNSLEKLQQDRTALQKVIERIEQQRALAKAEEEQRQRAEAEKKQREEAARQQAAAQAASQPTASPQAEPAAPAPEPPPAPTPSSATAKNQAYSADDLKRLQAQSFSQRKGRMTWPISGKLLNTFGETRQGSVQWDGLRIQSAAGTEVHAIHGGRVMYADWLRGQGMLIVLDHGDGFMSLYAHNDALLREPGEWVQPGDAIARVGNSGGEKESGLYFEIRHDGQPVDPRPWLTGH